VLWNRATLALLSRIGDEAKTGALAIQIPGVCSAEWTRERKKRDLDWALRPRGHWVELTTQLLRGYQQATERKMEISCRGEVLAQVPD
jgi:hypothetical protein